MGQQSYWWPNIPFREDYQATLHYLGLALTVDGKVADRHRRRFGFVEYGEGPWRWLIDAAVDVDPTRPYVFEVNPGRGTGKVAGMEAGHAYLAPWSWVNFWPNFLEGMSHDRHPWKANNHADRQNDVDGCLLLLEGVTMNDSDPSKPKRRWYRLITTRAVQPQAN